MNQFIRILGTDYPHCAHPDCRKLAEDGYCEASCCLGFNPRRAYCSEHSHRPSRVLEILGHAPAQETFTRAEVERIVKAMWVGAGMVYEAGGYFDMLRDLERRRAADSERDALLARAVAAGDS